MFLMSVCHQISKQWVEDSTKEILSLRPFYKLNPLECVFPRGLSTDLRLIFRSCLRKFCSIIRIFYLTNRTQYERRMKKASNFWRRQLLFLALKGFYLFDRIGLVIFVEVKAIAHSTLQQIKEISIEYIYLLSKLSQYTDILGYPLSNYLSDQLSTTQQF